MTQTKRSKAKVLVIDDEGDLNELLQIALKEDYTIELAFDGRSALTSLDSIHPDLIVTDSYLPHTDGFDFLSEIRKQSQVPIVIVLASKPTRKKSYFDKKGVFAIMVKPFTMKDLKSEIQRALSSQ